MKVVPDLTNYVFYEFISIEAQSGSLRVAAACQPFSSGEREAV
jgi:hypothetical protein